MGRYLERASHACRLLRTQVPALIDRPVEEIYVGWSLIYNSLRCLPPGGILESSGEDFTLADAFTLAGDLTFENTNLNSIGVCLGRGRENARQMRHCITEPMWLRLNHEYLDFAATDMTQVWRSAPEDFYSRTEQQLHLVFGLADMTMYRDGAWNFIKLGRSVERIQAGAALLAETARAARLDPIDETSLMRTVLSVFSARDIHCRVQGYAIAGHSVLDLLVSDLRLPWSLANHAAEAECHILGIGPGHSEDCGLVARSSARLKELISNYSPGTSAQESTLSMIGSEARKLNDRIDSCHFSYDVRPGAGK